MAYYFFLGDVMLPVPPAKMTTKIKNRNKTINLINEGEVNIVKSAGLTEISFDIRLPGDARPYANYSQSFKSSALTYIGKKLFGKDFSYKQPVYFLQKIKKLKVDREPFDLIVLRMSPRYEVLFDTYMRVTLESYSIKEDAGEGFDITVPVTLKQYVDYGTKEVEVSTDENGKQTVTVKQSRKAGGNKSLQNAITIRGQRSIWEATQTVLNGGAPSVGVLANIAILNGMKNPYNEPVQGTQIKIPNGVIH